MKDFKTYQEQKSFTTKTIQDNTNNVKSFILWLETEKKQIQNTHYNDIMGFVDYCKTKGNTTKTIRLKIKSIEHYFTFLEQSGVAEPGRSNPATQIKLQEHTRTIPHNLLNEDELKEIYELQHTKGLAGKRTKVLLSLVVFQGVAPIELERIELTDLDLLEGKIYIPATRTANSRTLELKPQQLLLFQDYIVNIRKEILNQFNRQSDKLLVSMGITKSEKLANVIAQTIRKLKLQYPKLKGVEQIRQSVITRWVEQFGLRKAQYMAGHRYVSSTERYNQDKLEGLKTDLEKHFPL